MKPTRYLESQTMEEPLKPIEMLEEAQGWVLLLGVDHTVNTSIHYAERLAGRKQFVRWALHRDGVVECPGFPGCSDGFGQLAPGLPADHPPGAGWALGGCRQCRCKSWSRQHSAWIEADPLALLCDHSYCERCEAVRKSVADACREIGMLELTRHASISTYPEVENDVA